MVDNQAALLDLFRSLQPELGLEIEQYELLIDAWERGYGQGSWDDLRRICRLIWLKTNTQIDPLRVATFDRIFGDWQAECKKAVRDWFQIFKPAEIPASNSKIVPLGTVPSIPPPRKDRPNQPPKIETPEPTISQPAQVPVATKVNRSAIAIRQLPITLADVRRTWRSLKRSIPDRRQPEFDLDGTIDKLNRDGYLYELVMRSTKKASVDLLLLIDNHHKMRPYRPVYEPLVRAITSRCITPAKIYRFISYPVDYLDDWDNPIESIHVNTLLSQLHSRHTVVFIVSDCGAATQSYSESRIAGTKAFLAKLLPCVREIFWLNPVSAEDWDGTSAAVINRSMRGRMIPFESAQWQKIGRQSLVGLQS